MLFADKPSPPRDVRVKEVNKDYAVVTWDAPESDGGSPITGYLVEKKDAAKKNYIKADHTDANTLELKVTKLVEGKEYDIRVFAENEIGPSDPAGLPQPVKARLPFGEYSYTNQLKTLFLCKTFDQIVMHCPPCVHRPSESSKKLESE